MDDDKVKDILAGLPEKPPRPRLGPHRTLIFELRRRGRTYREIVDILSEKYQTSVSVSMVHDFVRVHSGVKQKPRKRRAGESPTEGRTTGTIVRTIRRANTGKEKRPPTDDEVQRRILALKLRPVRDQATPKLFHYDPSEPLHLTSKAEKSGSDE